MKLKSLTALFLDRKGNNRNDFKKIYQNYTDSSIASINDTIYRRYCYFAHTKHYNTTHFTYDICLYYVLDNM